MASRHILICDPNEPAAAALACTLELLGASTHIVPSLAAALQHVRQTTCHCLIVDATLLPSDGAYRRLRDAATLLKGIAVTMVLGNYLCELQRAKLASIASAVYLKHPGTRRELDAMLDVVTAPQRSLMQQPARSGQGQRRLDQGPTLSAPFRSGRCLVSHCLSTYG